jgi:hypothetical protein
VRAVATLVNGLSQHEIDHTLKLLKSSVTGAAFDRDGTTEKALVAEARRGRAEAFAVRTAALTTEREVIGKLMYMIE